MEIRDTTDRAKHKRRWNGISCENVKKWAEEIVEKKADDKAIKEGLECHNSRFPNPCLTILVIFIPVTLRIS